MNLDGWVNLLTGLGDAKRDKTLQTQLVVGQLSYDQLTALYRDNDLAARIVDLPADEMLREGFDVRIDGDEQAAELLGSQLDDLHASTQIVQALKWRRLYGGAAILIGANDGSDDLSLPLNENAIRSVDYLTVFDPWECKIDGYYSNFATKEFGAPEYYRLQPHAMWRATSTWRRVHASRVIQLQGPMASRRQLTLGDNNFGQGWGDSVLLRCARHIKMYDTSWDGIGHVMTDFAQAIFKIKGLAQALLAQKESEGNKSIINRMRIIDMSRSVIRSVLLDADGEDFERKTTVLSGVPETMDKMSLRLAAAAGIPATVLYGQSPSGMNATGASDTRFFYDMVRAAQKRDVMPVLQRLVKLLMLAKGSPTKGREPEEWGIQFRSLWQMTDAEKADIRVKMATVDRAYLDMGVLSTDDIAESRFGGDEYSIETQVNLDAREEREAVAAETVAPSETDSAVS